jgi:multiple sugar transport system permease protein
MKFPFLKIASKEERAAKKLRNKKAGILTWIDYRYPWAHAVYTFIIVILVFFAILAVAPVLWLFISSFKNPAELYQVPYVFWPKDFNFNKIIEVWNYINFGTYFLNSTIVALGAVICAIVFNGFLAYVLEIVRPWGHKVIFGLILLSYMIPTATNIVPLFKQIAALNLIDSYIPLWFVFGANTFYLVMFKSYFASIPKPLFEAARMDGANDIQIFTNILVPLARPIIGVVAIFAFTASWSDFLLPYLTLQKESMQTIMVKIYSIQSTMATSSDFGPDKLLMLLVISIIPQIIIFALFQKQITGTNTNSGIKE